LARGSQRKESPCDVLIAESAAMRGVIEQIRDVAAGDAPALVEGEPGTGRELIARVIHETSKRRKRRFVAVSAGAGPLAALADPLSGQEAFCAADRGTLLVKNLADLSQRAQAELCRALERPRPTAAPDVRFLGTADLDLETAVKLEVFHQRLYRRFEHRIRVPPLRDRISDIAPLAAAFIRQYARELGRKRMSVSTRAYERLVTYPWPGNVAELKGVTRRLVTRVVSRRIEAGDVDAVLPTVAERVPMEEMSFEEIVRSKLGSFLRRVEGYPVAGLYDDVLARVERPLLELVMEHTGGNQVKAAEILGLNRNTLRRKLTERKVIHRTRSRTKPPTDLPAEPKATRTRRGG
jgi:two-component system, NtrC family, nitrogen regulation response regulator GlnG